MGYTEAWVQTVRKVLLDQNTLSNIMTVQDMETMSQQTSSSVFTDICGAVKSLTADQYISKVGKDVYTDIEFFKCFNDNNTSTLFDTINSCKLQGGSQISKLILSTPVYNTVILNSRKHILETFEKTNANSNGNTDKTSQMFTDLATWEADVGWLFEDIDSNLKDLYQMAYFKFCMFKGLNSNSSALTAYNVYRIIASPLIGIFSPILYFVIPYMIILFRFKIKISFNTYLKIVFQTLTIGSSSMFASSNTSYVQVISWIFSIIFYFQGIFNSVEISKTLHKIIKHLVQRTNNIVMFLKKSIELHKVYWNDNIISSFINCDNLKPASEEQAYVEKLDVKHYSLMNNFGQQLKTYSAFDKDIIKSITIKTYIIETMLSLVRFKLQHNYSYAEFVEQVNTPVMECKGLRHPCIDINKVIKNDITVAENQNLIITGPNAGGKSTFIKSLTICAILAQTCAIACCDSCKFTPFYHINSQINIPDSKGYESLFEAEMYRCKHNLDELKNRKPNEFTLVSMDEIFNSTNPVEGIAGAYSIAKKISEYSNCLLVFTTHYLYLTKLEKNTGRFINYKMNIDRLPDKTLVYPYILSRGISKQYIALELLEKNGFDADIIEEAIAIKERLTLRKP